MQLLKANRQMQTFVLLPDLLCFCSISIPAFHACQFNQPGAALDSVKKISHMGDTESLERCG